MKIWLNNGTADILLADHGKEGPQNFTPSVVQPMEVLSFVKSATALPRSKGNRHFSWSWSITKAHTSLAAAQKHVVEYYRSIPATAEVWLELDDQTTRYTLPNCVISFTPAPIMGARTIITHTLTFSEIIDRITIAASDGTILNASDGTELQAKGA